MQVVGQDSLGTRTELKHIAKFNSVRDCIQYEIDRQIELLESGKEVAPETRSVDLKKGITVLLRLKEDGRDYRYMPEPDLPFIKVHPVCQYYRLL